MCSCWRWSWWFVGFVVSNFPVWSLACYWGLAISPGVVVRQLAKKPNDDVAFWNTTRRLRVVTKVTRRKSTKAKVELLSVKRKTWPLVPQIGGLPN